jgi:hypothetical protein
MADRSKSSYSGSGGGSKKWNTPPMSRQAWNDTIELLNVWRSHPPADTDCEKLPPLKTVPPETIWSKKHVKEVQDGYLEMCPDHEFTEHDLWEHEIFDEINEAAYDPWCDCEPEKCYASGYTAIIFQSEECMIEYEAIPYPGPVPDPPPTPQYDYYSFATAVKGFGEGIGGSFAIHRLESVSGNWETLYSNSFDCSGDQTQPLPPPVYDSEGYLYRSRYLDKITTYLRCNIPTGFSFVGYAGCIYYDSCSRPPDPPIDYPWPTWTPPSCSSNVDTAYVMERHGVANGPCGTGRVVFVIEAKTGGSWETGLPCRKCCSDGIGFCGLDCDPTQPPCVEDPEA